MSPNCSLGHFSDWLQLLFESTQMLTFCQSAATQTSSVGRQDGIKAGEYQTSTENKVPVECGETYWKKMFWEIVFTLSNKNAYLQSCSLSCTQPRVDRTSMTASTVWQECKAAVNWVQSMFISCLNWNQPFNLVKNLNAEGFFWRWRSKKCISGGENTKLDGPSFHWIKDLKTKVEQTTSRQTAETSASTSNSETPPIQYVQSTELRKGCEVQLWHKNLLHLVHYWPSYWTKPVLATATHREREKLAKLAIRTRATYLFMCSYVCQQANRIGLWLQIDR